MLQAQLSGRKLTVEGTAAVDNTFISLSISPVSLNDNDGSAVQVTGTATGPISRVDLSGITNAGVEFLEFSSESQRLTVIGTSHDDRFTSLFDTDVRDFYHGRGGDDSLDTGFGNDRLEGGAGNDVINGGAGKDAAYYSGDRSDYRIKIVNGDYHITDLRHGRPDGQDIVGNIETLHFADKEMDLASPSKLVAAANGHGLTVSGRAATPGLYVTIDLDDASVKDNNITSTYVDVRGKHGALLALDLSNLRDAGGMVTAGTFDAQNLSARHVIGSEQRDYISMGYGDDVVRAANGNDFVAGGYGNDQLNGQAGDDLMAGGPGDDGLFGGRGDDTAIYSSSSVDYSIEYIDGAYRITTITPGSGYEGVDTLLDIEHLKFSDQTIDLDAMALQSSSPGLNPEAAALMIF